MLKQLKEWHEEEIADSEKYEKMASDSPKEYYGLFKDLAKEEKSHAKILEAIINDYSSHCKDCEETTATEENSINKNSKFVPTTNYVETVI